MHSLECAFVEDKSLKVGPDFIGTGNFASIVDGGGNLACDASLRKFDGGEQEWSLLRDAQPAEKEKNNPLRLRVLTCGPPKVDLERCSELTDSFDLTIGTIDWN